MKTIDEVKKAVSDIGSKKVYEVNCPTCGKYKTTDWRDAAYHVEHNPNANIDPKTGKRFLIL